MPTRVGAVKAATVRFHGVVWSSGNAGVECFLSRMTPDILQNTLLQCRRSVDAQKVHRYALFGGVGPVRRGRGRPRSKVPGINRSSFVPSCIALPITGSQY